MTEPFDEDRPNRGGRPPHVPTVKTMAQVEALAACGHTEDEIAAVIEINPNTLRKHYRNILATAHTKANARVAESLYRKALGDGPAAVTAAIFWLKTRARWKEQPQGVELSGPNGEPVKVEDISPRELVAGRIASLSARLGAGGDISGPH